MAASDVNSASATSSTNINNSFTVDKDNRQNVAREFVHEYYTFLNREPLRVYLFYSGDSTMSHGIQGEDAETCIGQQAIKTKIQELDFKDCKVLVTDIDCQGSLGSGIILQVLGELSNGGGPAQKFAQTFFLAEQLKPKGYYVRNDIFRYLKEDLDDEEDEDETLVADQESAQDSAAVVAATAAVPDQVNLEIHHDKAVIDTASDVAAAAEETVTKTQVQESHPRPITPPHVGDQKRPTEKRAEKRPSTDKKQTEKKAVKSEDIVANSSADSHKVEGTVETTAAPVSVVDHVAPAAAVSTTRSWAKLAASKPGAVTSAPASAAVPVAASPKPQVPNPPQLAQQQQQQQQRPQGSRSGGREDYHSIYIKNVTERMTLPQIRAAFVKFGPVNHLELTVKKNCAFLDFSTPEAMNAALKQNRIMVGDEYVLAEERRRGNHSSSANGPKQPVQQGQGQGQGQGPQGNFNPRGPRANNGSSVNSSSNAPRGGGVQQDRKPVQQNKKPAAAAAGGSSLTPIKK